MMSLEDVTARRPWGGLAKRNPPLLGSMPADCALANPPASHMHRGANAADIAEHAQIALDFRLNAGGFLRIVRQLHRRPSIDRRHLADDGDRIEIGRSVRGAADEVIGEIGAPTETDADAALEVVKGLLD